ncbi:uncharacterized protein LOC116260892 [Nymphaea colorata]|nr:uncharacterized protein LOC116260892 [Nymphaea colorata]XP_031495292.1 uncharacterized protein LOC116260892 [Nymphaea colorata]XP_031495315.1 uncharacterized protein LOC116260892 [Nymphaea colorata]XP_049931606.1 uncharacterized protein LOC116260892 [Nymphaea colorata]
MTISKPFSTTGWEKGMAVLDDDGCDYRDDQISSANILAGRMLGKSWASGSRVSGDSEYGERGIRSLSHRYEGGGVCIRDAAEGNDDEGRLLVSQVRTRRGIKRRHAVSLDFRVSSGKRKTMVYDDDVCDNHLVSRDFPECNLRTDGFESGVPIGETKIRNFGPSCVFEEEEVGGCKQRRPCLDSLVSDEGEETSVIGKKKKKRRRRKRKRKRKKKCKKIEENEYMVPEGTHDRQVSREDGEVEDEEYTELVEEEVGGCKQRRPCLDSLVSDEGEETSVIGKKKKKRRRRKRERKKKCKKIEENEYMVPEGTHDRQVSREDGEVEDEEYTELVEEEVGGCKQRMLCLNSLVSDEEEEISVIGKKKKRRRRRKRKNKCKKTEENEYVVPEGTHDRQVSREEGEVEDEEDAELVIKEKQNAPSMKQRKRYASEFAHCEVSVKRTRGEGGVERLGAGDIVWANSSEEEWWPGWVFMANKSKVLVPIFGQDKLCWLNDFQVLPFEENYVEKSKNAVGQLKVAIDNALEELGKRAALGLICSCEGLVNFNENEKSAVVDVPGYSKSSHHTLEQINKARAEFRPLEMLGFLQKAALSVFICESDTVGANRAIAQANAYRRVVSITPDWIYKETMRLTEMERADESDEGNWEAEPLASSLADNELCYRAYRSSNSLMVEVAAEEVENQMEVDEEEDGEGEEGAKNNLMIVERKEKEKDKVCEQPLHREEFQWNDMQKSNILLSFGESHDKSRNKTLLQEEIKGIEESEEDKLDLGFCVTNEMDFSSFSSNDQSGPQVSGTHEHIDVDEETNADDVEFLSDHRIKTACSRANEFRINPQQQIFIETNLPSLFETLTHLHRLALDPFYDSDGVAFVFEAFLRYRDITFLNIPNLKCLEVTLDRHCECSNSTEPKISVSPSYVAEPGNYATILHAFKKDSFEISSTLGGRENLKYSSFPSVPNSDMLSRPCQCMTTMASEEFSSVGTKMPSLLDTLTHLRCLALDPFSGAACVAFVSKAFLRYRAVTFLNIANLKFSEGTLNRHFRSGKNATREASTALPSVMEQRNGTISNCHAKKDVFGVGAIPYERDKVKGVCSSSVLDDAMLSRTSEQETGTAFNAVNKVILNVHGNLSFEANMPSLCEALTHLHCLALDPFYDPENAAFVCKTLLRYRAVRSSFSNVPDSDILSRSRQHISTLPSWECNSVNNKMPSLLDTLAHLRCLALDPFSGTVCAAFVSKAFLRYRAVTFLNITNLKFSDGILNRHLKSSENSTRENSIVLPSVTERGNGTTSDCHAKKDTFEVGAVPHERDTVKIFPCSAVPDDAILSRIFERESNKAFPAVNKLRPGLCKSLEHADSGSLLTKSCTNYISATAMPGDSQSAATDRIPNVSLTTDNRGANSDGGLPIQMATDQHDLDYATELCNSLSIAQGQFCSSSVKTLLGEMYLFLRCLACDPFFGGEHSTSAKRAFLRYRVASYEKIYGSSAAEYRHGMSNNHERLVSHSLSETWPNSRAIMDGVPDDSQKEKNVAPENDTKSKNQCFSSTATYAIPQTNGSGCAQNVSMFSETTSHTDLSKCFGNSFPRKRKSDEIPAANSLHKLRKPCGAVLLSNWYASPLTRGGLSRSVDDVQLPARSPTECTKIRRFFISPESHEVGSYLHMKFPKNFELPSQDQLMKTFGKFGPIDCLKTRVFFYTGSGQVCFQRHADAEAAFKFAREKVLFGQANIKFWVSRPAKSTHRVQGYNCTDIVGKPKSGESGNDDQSLYIDEQQLKDYDYTNRARLWPISNVKSCLRKLNQPGEKGQPKSSKVTFSVDGQSCLPAESIMSPLTLLCNHSLRKESGLYQQKMLSLLKDCEQLINDTRGSVGLQSYYEMLIHELRSSFRKPDE